MNQVEAFLRKVAHDPGDAQITSHCPFCGSGQIVGRSDGNIECEFCGMCYLVRVQPMFTGMPGNPMGGGFGGDSSIAPDLMAPEMLGPDGAPMMAEPGEETPGMEEEDSAMMAGGGPAVPGGPGALGEGEDQPGDEEDDAEGEENPVAGDDAADEGDTGGDDVEKPSDDDSGDDKPPKKKKGKDKGNKKEGNWSGPPVTGMFRTIAGDELPEDAFIRHLAVLHGGIEALRHKATFNRREHLEGPDHGFDIPADWNDVRVIRTHNLLHRYDNLPSHEHDDVGNVLPPSPELRDVHDESRRRYEEAEARRFREFEQAHGRTTSPDEFRYKPHSGPIDPVFGRRQSSRRAS